MTTSTKHPSKEVILELAKLRGEIESFTSLIGVAEVSCGELKSRIANERNKPQSEVSSSLEEMEEQLRDNQLFIVLHKPKLEAVRTKLQALIARHNLAEYCKDLDPNA